MAPLRGISNQKAPAKEHAETNLQKGRYTPTTGAIESHFNTNSNTLSKALNALQNDGKIKKDEKRSPWYVVK